MFRVDVAEAKHLPVKASKCEERQRRKQQQVHARGRLQYLFFYSTSVQEVLCELRVTNHVWGGAQPRAGEERALVFRDLLSLNCLAMKEGCLVVHQKEGRRYQLPAAFADL